MLITLLALPALLIATAPLGYVWLIHLLVALVLFAVTMWGSWMYAKRLLAQPEEEMVVVAAGCEEEGGREGGQMHEGVGVPLPH